MKETRAPRYLFVPLLSLLIMFVCSSTLTTWAAPTQGVASSLSLHAPITRHVTQKVSTSITEFPVPTNNSVPYGITAGPDGSLWFTEGNGNKIGRITTSGTITEFPVPTNNSNPVEITSGRINTIGFTEAYGNNIGVFTLG